MTALPPFADPDTATLIGAAMELILFAMVHAEDEGREFLLAAYDDLDAALARVSVPVKAL